MRWLWSARACLRRTSHRQTGGHSIRLQDRWKWRRATRHPPRNLVSACPKDPFTMKFAEPMAISGLVRTPIGRLGGILAAREAFDLQSESMRTTVTRVGVDVDEVIVGNVRNSVGNIARVAALEAGLPEDVPAMTVD